MNLEAMEFSRPVVATSFGGCPEVVSDGVSGFIANPYKVKVFADRIARLLRDPVMRDKMGAEGRRLLEERFLMKRLTSEFLEEYESALLCAEQRSSPQR
jgi:glycosyltransferase involved in cell wall biosynthesis